jgi:hypothetical protein
MADDLRHIPIADLMSELVCRLVARDRAALSAVTGLLSLLQMMGE